MNATHTCDAICAAPTVLMSLQPLRPVRSAPLTRKADPIWDQQFRCKITKKPLPEKMLEPKGFTGPVDEIIQRHLSREDELIVLTRTQGMEISPLSKQLMANGFAVTRFAASDDGEFEGGNFSLEDDAHDPLDPFNQTPIGIEYDPDPLTLAATSRRIEWEQAKMNCSATSRCRWSITPDGSLGIEYLGYRWDDKEYALAQKRAFKADWLATHESMPTVKEVHEANAFIAYYGNPALAHMTDEELEAFRAWRREDPTQSMDDLGADEYLETEENDGGPEELGEHNVYRFFDRETRKHVTRTAYEVGENSSIWNDDQADNLIDSIQRWKKAV